MRTWTEVEELMRRDNRTADEIAQAQRQYWQEVVIPKMRADNLTDTQILEASRQFFGDTPITLSDQQKPKTKEWYTKLSVEVPSPVAITQKPISPFTKRLAETKVPEVAGAFAYGVSKGYPSPLLLALKPEEKKEAEELAQEHKVASTIGELAGTLGGLTTLSGLTQGITPLLSRVYRQTPHLARFIPRAVQGATTFASYNLLKESSDQLREKKFNADKLIDEVGKGYTWGLGIGGLGGIAGTAKRIISSGAFAGTMAGLETKAKEGKVDWGNVLFNTALVSGFTAINAPRVSKEIRNSAINELKNVVKEKVLEYNPNVNKERLNEAVNAFVNASQVEFMKKGGRIPTTGEIEDFTKIIIDNWNLHVKPATNVSGSEIIKPDIIKDVGKAIIPIQPTPKPTTPTIPPPLITKQSPQPIKPKALIPEKSIVLPAPEIELSTTPVVKPEPNVVRPTPESIVQDKGITAEDFELRPELMRDLKPGYIAFKVGNDIISAKIGENGIYNHADLAVKKNIDVNTAIPGFLDKNNNFVEQYPATTLSIPQGMEEQVTKQVTPPAPPIPLPAVKEAITPTPTQSMTPEELKELNKKFIHPIWFQDLRVGSYKTKKEALEQLATMEDIGIIEQKQHIPGTPLLSEGKSVFYLTDGKYKYKLSPVEKKYWDKLKMEQQVDKDIVEKEPWQMTRDEYMRATTTPEGYEQYQRDLQLKKQGKATTGFAQKKEAIHQVAIRDAIEEGKPVPPEVLAEYPDLLGKPEAKLPTELVIKPEVSGIPTELEPLAEEAKKYGSASELTDKLKNVLEKRLPSLKESYEELVRATTRTEGKRGTSRETQHKALENFEKLGRQLEKEVSSILGYEDRDKLPYNLRSRLYDFHDQFSFDPNRTPEKWINSINIGISDFTQGQFHSLSDFYNKVVKPEEKQVVTPPKTAPEVTEGIKNINPLMQKGMVKTSETYGFSKEQADYLVNELLNIRDKIIKNSQFYTPDEEIVPYLTYNEASALDFGKSHSDLFEKNKKKFVALGLVDDKNNRVTRLGTLAILVNRKNSNVEPVPKDLLGETTEIKIPGNGIFKVKNDINVINDLLHKLKVKGQAPSVEGRTQIETAPEVKITSEIPVTETPRKLTKEEQVNKIVEQINERYEKRKEKELPTLYNKLKGKISIEGAKASGWSIEDLKDYGIKPFFFSKTGRSPDDIASELISLGVIPPAPETMMPDAWLYELLKKERKGEIVLPEALEKLVDIENEKQTKINKVYEKVGLPKPEGEVPSGYGFPKIPIKKTLGERPEFKPAVEMPEIVKLAKDLSGKTPVVKHLRKAYGFFSSPTGEIKLDAEIFQDELLSGQVLAHEIGHLIDWLPEHTLARGNLIGRLLTLQKYLRQTFGELNNKVIKQELKNLTQYWHPFDEEANPKFTKYRYKPQELYAEAISVLLNEPDKLKEIAPEFYRAFKDNLYKKPEVEEALTDLRNFIFSGEENILKTREESILNMFREGEELYSENRKIKRESQQLRWVEKFQKDYIDKNMPVIKMVEKDIKMGHKVNPDEDPRYYLEEYNYLSGKIKNVLYDIEQQVVKPVLEAGITTEDLGLYLFLNRVITERADIANPLGFNRTTAQKQLDYLLTKIGRYREGILKQAIDNFREIQNKVLKKAVDNDIIKQEIYDEISTNPNYATFQVLDYIDEYITPSIIQQKGTLKGIANPIDASVLKMISTIRAVERNKTRKVVVDYLKKLHPTDIEEAEPIRYGKYKTEFKERYDKGLIVLRENGTLKGYYVDPYIADTVMYKPAGTPSAIISMLSWANRSWFRPIYVNLNLGFQSYNLLRDFVRVWKLTPDVPFWKMIGEYYRAIPKAKKRAIGDFTDPVLKEMQENGNPTFS